MPDGYIDPFGKSTSVAYYADYRLPVQGVTDPVGNTVSVEDFDFRHLKPQLIKDANANLSAARYDALGFLVGTALMGKGSEADDFTGFVVEPAAPGIAAFFADPAASGATLLQHATSRFVYDFSVLPLRVGSIARETHYQAPLAAGTPSRLRYGFEYSDGFGNVAMLKAQTTPGIALALDGGGNVVQVDTMPKLRWIGTGRTVLNNKGNPVKQFEPYFSVTPAYEDDPKLVEIGFTPLLYYDPPGRNIRTEHPDGTLEEKQIGAWLTLRYDRNDTVLGSGWYARRTTGDLAGNPQENQAALKAAVHDDTPAQSHADVLGRAFYEIAHNKYVDRTTHLVTEKLLATQTTLDIEGKTLALIDPRGNTVVSHDHDMLGNPGHSAAMDSGERWALNDGTGNALYSFDSKTQTFHTLYDAARRPTDKTVAKGAAAPIVYDRLGYGEGAPGDQANNLRGRVLEHRDQAGVIASVSYDFKGNLVESTRVLTNGYQADVNWDAPPTMLPDTYTTKTAFDALSRPVSITAPSTAAATASVLLPSYNEAGVLDTMGARVRGAAGTTGFVDEIAYNEKGQRARIDYANGTSTIYKYDAATRRLAGLVTARGADPELFWDDPGKIGQPAYDGDLLQFLTYTHDPVGNVTYIKDDAQQTVYFDNKRVEPSADYTYDAVYRLIQSLGREHVGDHGAPGPFDDSRMGDPNPGDGLKLQTYTLQYDYDDAGNMAAMNNVGNWSMAFDYAGTSNQLQHAVPGGFVGTPFLYPYNEHGNTTAMPHLTVMEWDFADRLRHTQVSASGSVTQESWYVYDSAGQRVRKVVIKGNLVEERLYLGNIEIFRRNRAGADELKRETLQVIDDTRRIAMVDTPLLLPAGSTETQLARFQYANHLETASLELDPAAKIISYEEYYPFGSTSYQGTDTSREIPAKRYRYIGKERDEESGFSYCGSRYYAPWLARWISPDPEGAKDGPNLYSYCRDNPVKLHDPNGTQGKDPQAAEADARAAGPKEPAPAAPPAAKGAPDAKAAPDAAAPPAAPLELKEDISDLLAPPNESSADWVKRHLANLERKEALRLELRKLDVEIQNSELIAADKNRLRNPIIDPDSIPDETTLGIDLQIGGSYVGAGTKDAKGSFDAFQGTILARNFELIPLYYKKDSWDVALFKEPGAQYTHQRQPSDTGSGLAPHNTLGGTVDAINVSYKRGEVAITPSVGYDFNAKNLGATFVFGGKFTLWQNKSESFKVRLYGGVGVEVDKSWDPKGHSGYGGVLAGGGGLIEINPLKLFEKSQ
jgi:RHS repeat-associated protein